MLFNQPAIRHARLKMLVKKGPGPAIVHRYIKAVRQGGDFLALGKAAGYRYIGLYDINRSCDHHVPEAIGLTFILTTGEADRGLRP